MIIVYLVQVGQVAQDQVQVVQSQVAQVQPHLVRPQLLVVAVQLDRHSARVMHLKHLVMLHQIHILLNLTQMITMERIYTYNLLKVTFKNKDL